jgi:hypothetical protein
MTYDEVLTEITAITKRPDKSAEMGSNINKAISFFTLKANFYKDLVESSIAINPNTYGETLSIATALPRLRKIKYIRPRLQRYFLKPSDPIHFLSPTGILQPDRFYVAGDNLTFTLSKLDTFLEVGYYSYPASIISGQTHWMLDIIPWAIIERASSQIFKSIGDDISARFYESSSMEMFLAARKDFEDGTSAQAE